MTEQSPGARQSTLRSGQPLGTDRFCSILFPYGMEGLRDEKTDEPAYFADLNLDQVISAVVAKRDEDALRPFFYSPYRNEQIVRYRQAVFADLDRAEVLSVFPAFCNALRIVQANLAYADRISSKRHQQMVLLRAVSTYCEAVVSLLGSMQSVQLQSEGLANFRDYVARYVASHSFVQLVTDTRSLRNMMSQIAYSMLFRGDRVTVRKYASEPDYTATILDRFSRFREAAAELTTTRPIDEFGLNHIEEGILEFVGNLFSEEFALLESYVGRYSTFIDMIIATFEREIGFFIAYLAFIEPLKRTGLPFCYPTVSASQKNTRVCLSFDLALAAKLVRERQHVISNSFYLNDTERLIVISGPNQGGKTTFARMFGQLHFLAGLGCPVPGKRASLFLPDRIFTHFEREENIENLRGKLEDELVRLHQSLENMTNHSVIVLNEIFNSTSLEDQVFLSTKVLERILQIDAVGVCVTFIDSLSSLSEKTVSMVSTVVRDDPARRTFLVVRKRADGLAYALSLAEKNGVTYNQLLNRIRP